MRRTPFIAEIQLDDDVRLPGERREAIRIARESDGLAIADSLITQWRDVVAPQ
jgi:LDH2 family malate/lactate/ureidoglycolate dehydrogenase